jgi:RNA polymerase sigma factor (sigma-70 family)
MEVEIAAHSRWPDHLLALCRSVGPDAARTNGQAPQREEAWVALRDVLCRFLRHQAPRFASVSVEDQEDLASAKAFELLARAESGEWRLQGRTGGELAGYLSTVARNAMIDHAKQAARMVSHPDLGSDPDTDEAGTAGALPRMISASATEASSMAREFIGSLQNCLVRLQPRARHVWFLRAFYEMSTREIAQHPKVMLRVGHVDVLLQRARDAIRACMASKGLEPADMPTGTFTALWEWLESLCDEVRPAIESEVDS